MLRHNAAQTLQDWLYYREFGQASYGPPPLTPGERLVWRLRDLQKQMFHSQVATPQLVERLDNPPESVKSILEKRVVAAPSRPVRAKPVISFAKAVRNGVLAALVFMMLVGTVMLLTKIR